MRKRVEQLRGLVRMRAEVLTGKALNSDGEPAPEQVASLHRLVELLQTCEALASHRRRTPWAAIALLTITLSIASLLLFVKVTTTEVEFEVVSTEIYFQTSGHKVLMGPLPVIELGVSSVSKVDMPSGINTDALDGGAGGSFAVRLSVASGGKQRNSISLAPFVLGTGTQVWVRCTGVPGQYRLSFKGQGLELRTDVDGKVRIESSNGHAVPLEFSTPQPIHLRTEGDEVDLDLTVYGSPAIELSPHILVNDFSLLDVEEFSDVRRTFVRPVSTIISGELNLESIGNEQHTLKAGQYVELERPEGEMESLRLAGDHIDSRFHGQVKGIRTGYGQGRRSLMPTLLEWLKARHTLSLLWGTTLYLLGLVVYWRRNWRELL